MLPMGNTFLLVGDVCSGGNGSQDTVLCHSHNTCSPERDQAGKDHQGAGICIQLNR